MPYRRFVAIVAALTVVVAAGHRIWAQRWLHGIIWPEPPVVTPGDDKHSAPSDAVVLFDGKNLDAWKGAEKWTVDPDGAFTAKGKRALVPVEQAWDRYVALDPDPPDDGVAGLMVQAFSSAGLDKPEKAVRAMEMVIETRDESSNLYSQLAVLAYQAGQNRKGDLAADKAVALAPEAERKLLRENLDNAKAQSVADQASEAATTPLPAATGTTSTTG